MQRLLILIATALLAISVAESSSKVALAQRYGTLKGTVKGPESFQNQALRDSFAVDAVSFQTEGYDQLIVPRRLTCTGELGDDGAYSVAGLGRVPVSVCLELDGWASEPFEVRAERGASKDVSLLAAGGISVRCDLPHADRRTLQGVLKFTGTTTRYIHFEAGALAVDLPQQIVAGTYTVDCIWVHELGFANATLGEVTITKGEVATLEIPCARAGSLTVVETLGREPGEDAKFWFQPRGGEREAIRAARQAKRGKYRSRGYTIMTFEGLPLGPGTFGIEMPMFEPFSVQVEIPEVGHAFQRIVLTPADKNRLSGKVRDDEGKPIEGAEIWIDETLMGLTRDDGTYEIAGAFGAAEPSLIVRRPGFLDHPLRSDFKAGQSLNFELRRVTCVRGRIKNGAGGMYTIWLVKELRQDGEYDREANSILKGKVRPDGMFALNVTDPEVVKTRCFLVVAHFGRPFSAEVPALREGATVECDIEIPAGPRIHGRCTMPDGSPIAGARVALRPHEHSTEEYTRTGTDGSYRFEGVPAGEYWLAVRGSEAVTFANHYMRKFSVDRHDVEFNIDLTGLITLRLQVFMNEKLVDDVALRQPAGTAVMGRPHEAYDDWIVIVGLRPGKYGVGYQSETASVATLDLSDAVGEVERRVFVTKGGRTISGKCVLPAGIDTSQREQWKVTMVGFSDHVQYMAEDGSFTFENVSFRTYWITAELPGCYAEQQRIGADSTEAIELTMLPAATLNIVAEFVNESAGLAKVSCLIWNENRPGFEREVHLVGGSATVASNMLKPGEVTVRFRSDGYYLFEDRLSTTVSLETPGTITVKLVRAAMLSVEGLVAGMSGDDVWVEDQAGEKYESNGVFGVSKLARSWSTSLPPGKATLVVNVTGYKRIEKSIDLVANESLRVTVVMEPE